jgi:hypothetical protein
MSRQVLCSSSLFFSPVTCVGNACNSGVKMTDPADIGMKDDCSDDCEHDASDDYNDKKLDWDHRAPAINADASDADKLHDPLDDGWKIVQKSKTRHRSRRNGVSRVEVDSLLSATLEV